MNNLKSIQVFDNWVISEEEYGDVFDDIIQSQRRQCLENKKTQIIVSADNIIYL